MSGQNRQLPDVFDLVHDFVTASRQDNLNHGEVENFEGFLRDRPDARRIYARYLETTILMPRLLTKLEAASGFSAAKSPPPGVADRSSGETGPPSLGFLGELGRQGWDFLGNHPLLFSLLVALLFAAAAVIVHSGRENKETAAGARSEMPQPWASSSHLSSPSAFVARLAAVDCQWVDPEAALGDGALLSAGQKLELASGRVEIVFQSGAKVTLHGPAIFEIQSANSGFLTIGRLSARAATPQSHGFTVHSRTAATVDLGTEFNIVALDDGHSQIGVVEGAVEVQLTNGRERRRLGVGESIEVEPGTPSVIARIEPGEGTPAFKFPTIEPPSANDYADASRGHAHISVLRGHPYYAVNKAGAIVRSGPVEVLLDGKGQSTPDAPNESFFFADSASGMILLDLGQTVPVNKINTYSWHRCGFRLHDHTRATQKYYLYGSPRATPPGADGDLAAAGWTLIARVNTDEFFGFRRMAARPEQQAVSITAASGGPIGKYRYLLWDVRPTPSDGDDLRNDNTFYGEFDVFAVGKDQG